MVTLMFFPLTAKLIMAVTLGCRSEYIRCMRCFVTVTFLLHKSVLNKSYVIIQCLLPDRIAYIKRHYCLHHTHARARAHTHTHTDTNTHTNTHIDTNTHKHTHRHKHKHTQTHRDTHTQTLHTHKHTHTQTDTNTNTQT
jgi:hypothetical protein